VALQNPVDQIASALELFIAGPRALFQNLTQREPGGFQRGPQFGDRSSVEAQRDLEGYAVRRPAPGTRRSLDRAFPAARFEGTQGPVKAPSNAVAVLE
jgi:hypothetical protein